MPKILKSILILCFLYTGASVAVASDGDYDLKAHYTKQEYYVTMRDGVRLFTSVYSPKDKSKTYPILMKRTPYSLRPYGVNNYPNYLGPNGGDNRFAKEGYIFVYQDVRGKNMSEGDHRVMTPHNDNKTGTENDESSDTYDTVEWLLENVDNHNDKIGIFGISYPGFYSVASIIDTHPAIKAASPQAPMGDIYIGDDFHHNGAFFMLDAFRFFRGFDSGPKNPTQERRRDAFQFPFEDSYRFFLELGALHNVNDKIFHSKSPFWNDLMAHGDYDEYWKSRAIAPHLNNITANVMTVIGSFDAEDSYGGTAIYKSIEEKNPRATNTLVRGPWFHGGWVRSDGNFLGNVPFDVETSTYYKENIDLNFFNQYLKDKGDAELPEVLAFYSGENEWREHDEWPPEEAEPYTMYLQDDGGLTNLKPAGEGTDEYVSDPENPVPYTRAITDSRSREYMVEDQRFVANRPDVMVYKSDILTEDVVLTGPVIADLFVSVTGTDADFVVKVIDVFPDDFPEHENKYMDVPMNGYQMMVRGDIFRGKYRNGFDKPEAFTPGEVTNVNFTMPGISHTFKQGHRIMIQVQSSWFPLADRNPHKFMNIYKAKNDDYVKATHRIHRSAEYPSSVTIGRIPN